MSFKAKNAAAHIAGNIGFMLKQCFAADPAFIFISLGVRALRLITPVTGVVGIKLFIDALENKVGFGVIGLIVLCYCVLNVSKGAVDAWYNDKYLPPARIRISEYLDERLMQHTTSLDLASFDNAEFFDKYTRAKNEITGRASAVVTTLCDIVGCLFSIAALSAVIAAIEPVLLLCIGAGVALCFVVDTVRSKILYRFDRETTPLNRRIDYIRRIFYEPQYMPELRLFGIRRLGVKKYAAAAGELRRMLSRQGNTKMAFSLATVLLNSVIFTGGALLFLGWRVSGGYMGVGDFSAMFSAVFSFGDELYSFVSKFTELYQHSLYIDNLREVAGEDSHIENRGGRVLDPSQAHSIEFRDVSFSYPGGARVLEHVNLSVGCGEKVVVAGYNGAGKSTLVKLMCRLYDPDEGEILLDGVDLREYDAASLRSAFGIVMQDFHHYSFTIAENICPDDADANGGAIDAAVREADLEGKISTLPRGLQSPLTREFDRDGVVMSGGEFQKLSLARAVCGEPHILILDEMTSALDPIAEARLNDTVFRASGGKSVIFISHRLNVAKEADSIYVFERGRVAEHGNHTELMRQNGLYAELFNAQAKRYA